MVPDEFVFAVVVLPPLLLRRRLPYYKVREEKGRITMWAEVLDLAMGNLPRVLVSLWTMLA